MTNEYPDSLCVTRQRKEAAYSPRPKLESVILSSPGFLLSEREVRCRQQAVRC